MKSSPELIDAAAWVGRQQAFAVIASKCSAAQAQCLQQVRESRIHDQFGLTWEEFCRRHFGISRSSADRIIQQYSEFGKAYFRLSELARISPDAFRAIADHVDDETITIDGEEVPLVPENAPRIRARLDTLRSQLRAEKRRTEPALIELRMRSEALLDEVRRRVNPTLPNTLRDPLKDLARDALRRWNGILRDVEKLDAPYRRRDEDDPQS